MASQIGYPLESEVHAGRNTFLACAEKRNKTSTTETTIELGHTLEIPPYKPSFVEGARLTRVNSLALPALTRINSLAE
eukprot:2427-Heterococcus_DN1.PRE.1